MSKEKEQLQAEEIYLENTCDYLISFNLIFTNPHIFLVTQYYSHDSRPEFYLSTY